MLTDYIIGVPPKNTTAYIVAKNALRGLARSLATEAAPSGVTVNCVAPYMMETRFLQDTPDLIVEASAAANPMGRNARVEDVVPAMAFLLSDEAGFHQRRGVAGHGGRKVLSEYVFRLALPEDKADILTFMNTHWGSRHPLVNLPDYFSYYYQNGEEHPAHLNFALCLFPSGEIAALCGFIPPRGRAAISGSRSGAPTRGPRAAGWS